MTATPRLFRRSASLAAAAALVLMLTACRGGGGGYLPPGPTASEAFPETVFTGGASFGFSFSCEDNGGVNPPTGQFRLQLTYSDHGTSDLIYTPFTIHGTSDEYDPVLESAICIGQEPPLDGNMLNFLGRYRPTGSPSGFLQTCPRKDTPTSPLCRFEVVVQDNDGNLAASEGDFFSIKLSTATDGLGEFDPATVFYARAGYLTAGNVWVN